MIHRFIPQAYTTFDTILALNPSLMQSHVSIDDPFLQPRIIQGNEYGPCPKEKMVTCVEGLITPIVFLFMVGMVIKLIVGVYIPIIRIIKDSLLKVG